MAQKRRPKPDRTAEDSRTVAWKILCQVEAGGYADALLGTRLRALDLPPRDRALTTRLVYGTLAWQGYLDHVLAAFSHRPVAGLAPEIRTLLRLALYQLCLLTRIPDFAAVDTAVRLSRSFRHGAAAGLVNAILRRAAKEWREVPLPSPAAEPVRALAVRWSHPAWLVERWLADYGLEQTEALLRIDNEPAASVLRCWEHRLSRDALLFQLSSAGVEARPGTYSPAAVVLEPGTAMTDLPPETQALTAVQGEASQLVGFLVDPQPGERVLDACAAPGGKATHLAELMGDRGELVAVDIHHRGVAGISELARRLGLSIVRPVCADATNLAVRGADADAASPALVSPGFDRVLVDAPCSGLGTLRAHPEVRWRRNPAGIGELAALQRRLLSSAARAVRPGGVLVYATCTLSRAENDDVVAAFLEAHPGFAVEDARGSLPLSAHGCVDGSGFLRTLPHRDGLDGFFAVRLKRRRGHDIFFP